MYLAVNTRPDIAFAVNNLACFSSNPQKEHWTALKQTLRYLKGTTNIGIYKQDGLDKCIGYRSETQTGAAQECLWLRQLEAELGCPPEGPTSIFEENQSAIAMAKNPQFHGRAKHMDSHHHFAREQLASGTIKLD